MSQRQWGPPKQSLEKFGPWQARSAARRHFQRQYPHNALRHTQPPRHSKTKRSCKLNVEQLNAVILCIGHAIKHLDGKI